MANITRRGDDENRNVPQMQRRERFDPFRLMTEMLQLSPFFDRPWGERGGEGMMMPAFEVKERSDAYVIEADVPGVREDDIDISVTQNRMTISGRREVAQEDRSEQYYTFERQYGSFSRSFTLPDGTDVDHIDADIHNGVLSIVIPKKEGSKPRKISLKQRLKKSLKS